MTTRNEDGAAPLAERMRPRTLEEVVGQDHLLGKDGSLARALHAKRLFSVIFWGPPGSGKTTLARLISQYAGLPFHSFSAVTSGVKELRLVLDAAERERAISGLPTLLFVDEIHRFNKAQQDAFLPHVEGGRILLIGATTQNPSFEVIAPLLSRTRVATLKALGADEIAAILTRALSDPERGLGRRDIRVSPEAMDLLVNLSGGDARVALNNLEAAVSYAAGPDGDPCRLDLQDVERALHRKALIYDKDGEEHYNLISALHKSLRGGNAHASLYWLYRMLMAGEDPLFIARRMIRFATEDVGMADPGALQVALAAFDAWEKVGPPEAELALAEAAVYLAAAPKSNALYMAEKSIKEEIGRTGALPVPLHIRNPSTRMMKELGYGKGYLYPHNYPGGRVTQEYLPEGLANRRFYRPTPRGLEKDVARRLGGVEEQEGT